MKSSLMELINAYDLLVRRIEDDAYNDESRAYGGVIRAGKGLLVESMAKRLVEIAWEDIGGNQLRLSMSKKSVKIPIDIDYVRKIPDAEIRRYIEENIEAYFYRIRSDVHVYIDGALVMGIECKAYTENAMLKRILVDFTLLTKAYTDLVCVLFQLESQLGGDYSQPLREKIFGSHSSHTLMSYFDVDLKIITLLPGERRVNRPIHKAEFYKPLQYENIEKAARQLCNFLHPFL